MKHIAIKFFVLSSALALAGGCSKHEDPQVSSSPSAPAETETRSGAPAGQAAPDQASRSSTDNEAAGTRDTSRASGAPASAQIDQAGNGSTADERLSRSSRFIDYQVVNQHDEKIGQVKAVWEDEQGEPVFIGMKRPAGDGLVLVPADAAQVNGSRQTVRVQIPAQVLEQAPTLDQTAELDEPMQERLSQYYSQYTQHPSTQQGTASATAKEQDQASIPLRKEEASVGKQTVDAGGVLLRKVVRTETNREPVTLRREELVIQRVPEGTEITNTQFGERDIYIPLRREVPVINRDTVVKETVRVGKQIEQQHTNINTQVREEQLKIQEQDKSQGLGRPPGTSSGSGGADSGTERQREGASPPE